VARCLSRLLDGLCVPNTEGHLPRYTRPENVMPVIPRIKDPMWLMGSKMSYPAAQIGQNVSHWFQSWRSWGTHEGRSGLHENHRNEPRQPKGGRAGKLGKQRFLSSTTILRCLFLIGQLGDEESGEDAYRQTSDVSDSQAAESAPQIECASLWSKVRLATVDNFQVQPETSLRLLAVFELSARNGVVCACEHRQQKHEIRLQGVAGRVSPRILGSLNSS
jgi:hypothetical protein